MNVFYLSNDAETCAKMHCDKHVVKMIIEYAQLMSTAHRMLDGELYIDKTANGRNIKRWRLKDSEMEATLYKASHINHPSAIWARDNASNYNWLYEMWLHLCHEYTARYGKVHLTQTKLESLMANAPKNIKDGAFWEPTPAMPEHCKLKNVVSSYRKYYITEKKRFANWKNAKIPKWFQEENYADLQLSL